MWLSVSLFFYMLFFSRVFEKHGSIEIVLFVKDPGSPVFNNGRTPIIETNSPIMVPVSIDNAKLNVKGSIVEDIFL